MITKIRDIVLPILGVLFIMGLFYLPMYMIYRETHSCNFEVTFSDGKVSTFNVADPNRDGFVYLKDCNANVEWRKSSEVKLIKKIK